MCICAGVVFVKDEGGVNVMEIVLCVFFTLVAR